MLKRVLSLVLSIVMVLSAVPFQVFAEEAVEEVTEAVQIEAVEPLAEEALPEETEAPAEEPEVIEPEIIEPEITEPEITEPEETEPEETEPEETEPQETEAGEVIPVLPQIPATRVEIRPETLTKTQDVRVVEVDENGNIRYYDTTETTSTTYMVAETVRNYPAEAKTIYGEDNYYGFETFEDLKELCAKTYSEYATFSYWSEDPLVISEDLTLPVNVDLFAWNGTVIVAEGVTLSTDDYSNNIYADTLIINGTVVNRGWVYIETLLEVNGTLMLYSNMGLDENATVSGYENIQFMYDYVYLEKQFYTTTFADFKAALAAAKKDTSGIGYYIDWYPDWDAEGQDLVLEESVTIPAHVRVGLGDSEGTFTIPKGVTLEINSENYASLMGDVIIHGKLVNNAEVLAASGTLTVSSTGSYSGNGRLRHYTNDPNEKLSDWLSGLDLTNFEITEDRYPEYNSYSWTLRDVTGLTKLGTPKNPQWNKEYTWVYNEKKDTWVETLVDRMGSQAWTPVEPDQGFVEIVTYKDGQEYTASRWHFGSYELPAYRSIDDFILTDPESGTYSFTVQSIADGNNYRNSDIATSGTWTYTKPGKSLGTCTNLTWNWPAAQWTTPDGSGLMCQVEFFYSPTADGEPMSLGYTWGPTAEWGAELWDDTIQQHGTGYYYFRVRPLSDDITKICNGTWSELSPAYNLDKTVENVKNQLDNISTKDDDEVIRDTVQSLDTEELRSAMLADKGSEGIMDQLEELENAVGGAAPVEVKDDAIAFDAGKISIVGANLNDAAENSADPITLVLDKPQEEHILDAAYDNAVAISFSMTLENVADAENLEVPVKITLPVPESINPNFLVILHYKQNGEIEELTLGDVHIYKQGNDTYASFVLTSFSDFVMTNYADNAIASGVSGGVNWEVTGWGKLILSGEGGTGFYYDDWAPWAEYADQITSIVVEEGITEIGYRSFEGLTKVTEVSLPDTLTWIDLDAFANCSSLKTITLPASVIMERNVFAGCTSLTEILVAEGNEWHTSEDGVLFLRYVDGAKALTAYPAGKTDAVYTVPADVSVINYGAFKGTRNLTKVVLPENLRIISMHMFEDSGIEVITIPDSVSYIYDYAFSGSELETITIPENVTGIAYYAFNDCSDLETIYFEGDPMPIAENAFTGVEADAYYPADNENWTEDFLLGYGGNLTWIPSNYVAVTGATEVEGGKSVKLTAKILPSNAAGSKITWSLAEGDEEYASIKVSGSTVTVTAVDVSELRTITVIASSAEGIAPCKYELTIIPKVKQLMLYEIWWDEDGEQYENNLAEYAWWWYALGEWSEGGFYTQLEARALPEGSKGDVTWTSSNTKVATIDKKTGEMFFTGKSGMTTITATDKSGAKATVVWRAIKPVTGVEAVGDTTLNLIGGQSATLKVRNTETGNLISNKNIMWELYAEDGSDASAYVTINASGKLTAKKVVEKTTIHAIGYALTDDLYDTEVYAAYEINLYPATTHVELEYNGALSNGKTVTYDVNSPEPGMIMAQLLPSDAMPVDVKWEISDKKGTYAEYTIGEVPNTLLISNPTGKAGTVTIKATAQDGSKKSATMKVQFGTFATDVTILNTETELVSGKSLTLKAEVGPENVTQSGVTWSLADPADKAYVTLSKNKLTAKTVYEEKTVKLVAMSKDGCAAALYDITIVPKDPGMLVIYDSYTGENVTKGTIYVDLTEKDRDVYLVAKNYADGSEANVTWSVSGKIADWSAGSGKLWLFMQKAGSVTVTAKEGKRTTTVTIKAANLGWNIDITTKNGKNIVQDVYGQDVIAVASGKSVDLKATVLDRNGRAASSSKVTWSIVDGGQYATITSAGKVTAVKDLTATQYVTVRATAADGSGVVAEETVMIKPLATGIQIYTLEEDVEMRTLSAYSNSWKNNRSNTNLVWDMAQIQEDGTVNDSFQIYSNVYPYYGENDIKNAMQAVTWKSSSPKIASVDENGLVTCLKPGTTTITATAADGSGQKISFKLTVVKRMTGLWLNDLEIAGGKSVTLKPIIEPADTTNKKLYWGIYGDTAFASINQSGKLTTKKVTSVKTVYVYAYALDGSGFYTECAVNIYPKAVSKMELWYGGKNVTGKTVTLTERTITWMELVMEPDGKCSTNVTWKSSDPESVSVDENGIITAYKATKKPVTITCTATDGSNKKVTVKIKVEK